jgi:hypothetical protein
VAGSAPPGTSRAGGSVAHRRRRRSRPEPALPGTAPREQRGRKERAISAPNDDDLAALSGWLATASLDENPLVGASARASLYRYLIECGWVPPSKARLLADLQDAILELGLLGSSEQRKPKREE